MQFRVSASKSLFDQFNRRYALADTITFCQGWLMACSWRFLKCVLKANEGSGPSGVGTRIDWVQSIFCCLCCLRWPQLGLGPYAGGGVPPLPVNYQGLPPAQPPQAANYPGMSPAQPPLPASYQGLPPGQALLYGTYVFQCVSWMIRLPLLLNLYV